MRIKTTLTIHGTEREIAPECLRNWSDVVCTCKRSDLSGVGRELTSKFEFVGDAYETLTSLYMSEGFSAEARLALYCIEDDWTYTKFFESPLDFSTLTIENETVFVSAIDNSLAALISANKGTKYEFLVGEDIAVKSSFQFDRLPMQESVTYELTNGESDPDTGALLITHPANQKEIIVGSTASEVCIGKHILWNDDQTEEEDSFILQSLKSQQVGFDFSMLVDTRCNSGDGMMLNLKQVNRAGEVKATKTIGNFGGTSLLDKKVGEYTSPSQLPQMSGGATDNGKYALVGGIVYECAYKGGMTSLVWERKGVTEEEYAKLHFSGQYTFTMSAGDKLMMRAIAGATPCVFKVLSSSFRFSWTARGDACEVDAFTPLQVLNRVLEKMTEGRINARGEIRGSDPRVSRCVVAAAESFRGLSEAKLYVSFSDFASWMEAVFGYTYYLADPEPSRFSTSEVLASAGALATPRDDYAYHTDVPTPDLIYFNSGLKKFIVVDQGVYYVAWNGEEEYNDPDTDKPYTDKLYLIGDRHYTFTPAGEMVEYEFRADTIGNDFQRVVFLHRSELFNSSAQVKTIADAVEGQFKIDYQSIYASVEIGYDKKDYDSVNGRDEFNFLNSYTTGCTLSDKKLSLVSKFRADCYGMEFAAQKRGESSTDSSTDNSVFFVLCTSAGSKVSADRSLAVEGANGQVFNAGVSPLHCARANAGLIGMQGTNLLKFASSEANVSATIDGERLDTDVTLADPIATCAELSFSTKDDALPDMDALVQVEIGDLTYKGYVKEVEFGISREQATKYTLIVKSMQR